jgi:hypothetical protein
MKQAIAEAAGAEAGAEVAVVLPEAGVAVAVILGVAPPRVAASRPARALPPRKGRRNALRRSRLRPLTSKRDRPIGNSSKSRCNRAGSSNKIKISRSNKSSNSKPSRRTRSSSRAANRPPLNSRRSGSNTRMKAPKPASRPPANVGPVGKITRRTTITAGRTIMTTTTGTMAKSRLWRSAPRRSAPWAVTPPASHRPLRPRRPRRSFTCRNPLQSHRDRHQGRDLLSVRLHLVHPGLRKHRCHLHAGAPAFGILSSRTGSVTHPSREAR